MIAVAIGPDSRRVKSQKVLNQTGGENVLYVADYPSLNDAVNDVFNLICSMYLMSSMDISLKSSCGMFIVNDEEFVKNNSKR